MDCGVRSMISLQQLATCALIQKKNKTHSTWFVCFYSDGIVLTTKYGSPPNSWNTYAWRYGGTSLEGLLEKGKRQHKKN